MRVGFDLMVAEACPGKVGAMAAREGKSHVSPEAFRQFCNKDVP